MVEVLDADLTFLNESLSKRYGVEGVTFNRLRGQLMSVRWASDE